MPSSSDGSQISPGEIIGIVLAILVFLLSCSLSVLFLRRRKLNRSSSIESRNPQMILARMSARVSMSMSSNRSHRFKPAPISIPPNSLSLMIPTPLLSSGSNASSLRVVNLEEGNRGGYDEEEILCEGIHGAQKLVTGRRSFSKASIPNWNRNNGELDIQINTSKDASYGQRSSTSSGGFATVLVRSSGARESCSPFRASLDQPPPSKLSRSSLEDIRRSGEISLSPAPRRRASRASISSLEPASAPADPPGRDRAGSLKLPAASKTDRRVQSASEPLAPYVVETFSERLSLENQNPLGLRRRRSGVSIDHEVAREAGRPRSTNDENSLQVKEDGSVHSPQSSQVGVSPLDLKSCNVAPSTAPPPGFFSTYFTPEAIEKQNNLKRRSRSQSRIDQCSKSPPLEATVILKSPSSTSRFMSRERSPHSNSAPSSIRGSLRQTAMQDTSITDQNLRLPSPIYGRYDRRRSVWSADTASLQSDTDDGSHTNSNSSRSGSSQGIGSPRRKKPSRLFSSPLRPFNATSNPRDSASSLSLRAQIERAHAWTQAFDESQGTEHGIFYSLHSPRLH